MSRLAGSPPAVLWAEVLEQVAKRPRLRSLLARLTPLALDGQVLLVGAPAGSLALAKDHAAEMADLAGRVTGRSMRVEVVEQRGPTLEPASPGPDAEPRPGAVPTSQPGEPRGVAAPGADDPANHPLVRQAAEVFGATVVRVERRLPPGG